MKPHRLQFKTTRHPKPTGLTGGLARKGFLYRRTVGFALLDSGDTIGDMIAMANPFAGYMTVRQVMDAIGARAHSTVTRLVYDEDKPRPPGRVLAGTLIPGHGWMIQKKSVDKFIADEERRPKGVGFPRGHVRDAIDQEPKQTRKKPAKSARAAKKPSTG